ncbi:hypothetical protein [Streptomyces sp. NPDC020681]|uniref:hypothetical protein n=1 Tax=Streptomyces sp. NPDC020681 TaxID=3365083 RepID=UPI00378B6043
MVTFATVIVLLAMIAVGVLALQLFTTRHDDRMAALPSGRSQPLGKGSGRAAAARSVTGGLWRRRPWRRTEEKSLRNRSGRGGPPEDSAP